MTVSDRDQSTTSVKQAALMDSLAHSSVLVPTALGGTALLAAFGLASSSPLFWLGGLAGLVIGGVAATWRLLKHYPELVQQSLLKRKQDQIDNLASRLAADGNPITEQLLADLRICAQKQQELEKSGQLDDLGSTIHKDLERLITGSLDALRHLADLWDQMSQLQVSSAKESLATEREQLITELQENLPLITQQLQALQHRKRQADNATPQATSAHDLARLRKELTANIAVAERVEQRLKQFDRDFESPSS